MELIAYIQILRRWFWLVLIAAIIMGGFVYVITRGREPVYEAQVKVFTGGFLQDPDPASSEIQTGTDLALTYANLATVRPTLQATIDALDLKATPEGLAGRIETSIIPGTSILVITVRDTDPITAAEIANELGNQLILNSPTNLTPQLFDLRQLLEVEISELSTQLAGGRREFQRASELLDNPDLSIEERSTLQAQRSTLLEQISVWQQSLANLTESLNSIDTQTNRLSIVEPALVSDVPIASSNTFPTVLAALMGMALAYGFALIMESLDDAVRAPEDLREVTDLPVLGGIVQFGNRRDSNRDRLISMNGTSSGAHEGYRTLRTNLVYGHEMSQLERLIVTSGRPAEGKSTTASNLAVMLAKAELKTVLIDADFHQPRIHDIFGMENRVGLTSLFNVTSTSKPDVTIARIVERLLQPTELPKLNIITSGPMVTNPAELFGLPHISNLCHSLKNDFGVDIILFDTPPVLAVVDSVALASRIKSSVLVVLRHGKTRRQDTARVLEQFQQVGIDVVGTVLNQVKSDQSGHYYYYGYSGYNRS